MLKQNNVSEINNGTLIQKKPHPAFSYFIYIGCAVSFLTTPFGFSAGKNLFYLSSYIAFFAFIFNLKYYTNNKFNLIFASSFFLFGIATIFWLVVYKQPGDYIDIYRSYMSTARLHIATAFIMLIALNERLNIKKHVIAVGIIVGITVNLYAIYQGLWKNHGRIELNYDRATIVAYFMTAINLVMMQSIKMLRNRHRILLYLSAFLFTFAMLILTGTRAAMLAYPVLILISIIATKGLFNSRQKLIILISFPLLLIASSVIFNSQIDKRINDFHRNLATIDNTKLDNSVFSRVWMQIVAIRTGNEAPFGQSAEHRAAEALNIIHHEPRLNNVKRYLTVHLHNEILETWSLRGIWGVSLLLFIYCSLLTLSFKPQRNVMLLGVTLSLIIYGLSDVLFFSTECTVIFALAIIASILSTKDINQEMMD